MNGGSQGLVRVGVERKLQSLLSAGSVGEDVSEQVHPFRIENFKKFTDTEEGRKVASAGPKV